MSQKKFAVFDIDGTLIRWQLFHAIVNQLIKQGSLPKKLGDQIQEARLTWKQRAHSESFREYEQVLLKAYLGAIQNLAVDDFDKAVNKVFEEYKDQVYTYTRDLIRQLKKEGYMLFAISGSQQEIITKLADYYGFDEVVGQAYEQKDGKLTSIHTEPMHHKDKVLNELVEKYGTTFEGSIAIGDSESDIVMLELVERPIVFNPSKGLFEHAKKHGWPVIIERKNMIYKLENQSGQYKLV